MGRRKIKRKNRVAPKGGRGCLTVIIIIIALILLIMNFGSFMKLLFPYPYSDIIKQESARYDIDPALVAAIIKAESNFDTEAVSQQGAEGLMQLMPETAEWISGHLNKSDFSADQLSDPGTNIELGCWYLDYLNDRFEENVCALIAAYNAGQGIVSSWLEEGLWDGSSSDLDSIPYYETQRYVERVIQNYNIYKNLYEESEE